MPHQCIECGRTFPDGSKEMLSGCPDCGGNKFQFRPAGQEATRKDTAPDETAREETAREETAREPERPDSSSDPNSPTSAKTPPSNTGSDPAPAGATDEVSDGNDTSGTVDAASDREETTQRVHDEGSEVHDEGSEDAAQASARSDVVSRDELDRASREVSATGAPDSDDSDAPRPDVDELRNELNEQFESIRIVSPGQYELNLMELYDRQEYIISLQEDGRYVIEMPDAWGVED